MKVISLHAKNFLSYEVLNFDFTDKGLTLIEGEVGAGKSTLLDGICYGLFGSTSKKLKADEVINRKNKKNLEVILKFQDNGEHYEVHRYRKHKEHDNDFFLVHDSKQIRGKDARETQKLLQELLGFNADIFHKASYFGQFDSIDKFLSASDTQKKELISDICDLSSYDEILDKVKENLKFNEEEFSKLERSVEPAKAVKENLMDSLASTQSQCIDWNLGQEESIRILKENSKQWDEDHKAKLSAFDSQIAEYENARLLEISKVKDEVINWEKEKQEKILATHKMLDNHSTDINKQLKDTEASLKHLQNNQDALLADITRLSSVDIDPIKEFKKVAADNLAELEKIRVSLYENEAKKNSMESKNNELRKRIKQEQHKTDSGADSDCPFCHQSISADYIKNHIDTLIKEGLSNKEEIELISNNISNANSSLSKSSYYETQIQDCDSKIRKYDMDQQKIVFVNNSIQENKSSQEFQRKQLVSISKTPSPYHDQLKSLQAELCPLQNREDEIMKRLNPFLSAKTTALQQVNTLPQRVEDQKAMVNPYIQSEKDINVRILKIDDDMKESLSCIGLVKHQIDLGEFWKEGLGVYIRSYLMDSFMEQLTVQANKYLQTLFDGGLKVYFSAITTTKKGIKEKISQTIYNGAEECSYNSLSGGERCRICLAVNLALSDITCKSLGKTFSILMLDEIFTGLNTEGKAQTMNLLKELENRFDTIFVIDHTDEFKSLFSNVITIEKEGGLSRIV